MATKFKNLEAEMIRHDLTAENIAEELEISVNTVRRKLNGEVGISIKEGKNIQKLFCERNAEFTIDYLFAE